MRQAPQTPSLPRRHRPARLALARGLTALAALTVIAIPVLGNAAVAAAATPSGSGGVTPAVTAPSGSGGVTPAATSPDGSGGVTPAATAPRGSGTPARFGGLAAAPAGGILRPGMQGAAVVALQQRLAQLRYYPGALNGYFGTDTLEAVWAFKEVQGLQTAVAPDAVGPAMRRALARPRLPVPMVPGGGQLRIEVNLAREYLVLYHHNRVDLISHVSAGGGYYYPCRPGGGTCGPAITPDGNYHAHWFARGWLHVPLGRMYNPVFFIGSAIAIHGDRPIPLRPASHGCVRVPVDVARFLHDRIRIGQPGGTPIYIRGHAPGTWPVPARPARPSRDRSAPQRSGSSAGQEDPQLMTPPSHR
jgi:L,D-transpeptidase catalytic domain/Putative peptidoglycan binding domain